MDFLTNKILRCLLAAALILLLVIVIIPADSASAATNVSVPAGVVNYSYSHELQVTQSSAFAGVQFSLAISGPGTLVFNSFLPSGSVTGGTQIIPPIYRGGVYTFGFTAGSNIFSGLLDAGVINFTFSGNAGASFTITEARVLHFPNDGKTSEWLSVEADILTVNFSRESAPPIAPPIVPPSGGTGGGTAAPAVSAPEMVELPVESPPLLGLRGFAAFINGFPDGTFRGDAEMTREQFVNILYKISNPIELPLAAVFSPSFDDVASDRWSFDAIEWAVFADVVDSGGAFRPSVAITRAEMAVMLVRMDRLTVAADNVFSDIEDHLDFDSILIAVYAGVFEGYPDGTFRPDSSADRNEVVAVLVRYLLGGEPSDEMWGEIVVPFSDVSRSHWAYRYIALSTTGYTAVPM